MVPEASLLESQVMGWPLASASYLSVPGDLARGLYQDESSDTEKWGEEEKNSRLNMSIPGIKTG